MRSSLLESLGGPPSRGLRYGGAWLSALSTRKYERNSQRAYVELREDDADGGEVIVVAIFTYRRSAVITKRALEQALATKARHMMKRAAAGLDPPLKAWRLMRQRETALGSSSVAGKSDIFCATTLKVGSSLDKLTPTPASGFSVECQWSGRPSLKQEDQNCGLSPTRIRDALLGGRFHPTALQPRHASPKLASSPRRRRWRFRLRSRHQAMSRLPCPSFAHRLGHVFSTEIEHRLLPGSSSRLPLARCSASRPRAPAWARACPSAGTRSRYCRASG